jgi:hypothetical protein
VGQTPRVEPLVPVQLPSGTCPRLLRRVARIVLSCVGEAWWVCVQAKPFSRWARYSAQSRRHRLSASAAAQMHVLLLYRSGFQAIRREARLSKLLAMCRERFRLGLLRAVFQSWARRQSQRALLRGLEDSAAAFHFLSVCSLCWKAWRTYTLRRRDKRVYELSCRAVVWDLANGVVSCDCQVDQCSSIAPSSRAVPGGVQSAGG